MYHLYPYVLYVLVCDLMRFSYRVPYPVDSADETPKTASDLRLYAASGPVDTRDATGYLAFPLVTPVTLSRCQNGCHIDAKIDDEIDATILLV